MSEVATQRGVAAMIGRVDVTTFEVELEQEKEKTEKIAQVAARAASIA